MRRFPVLITSSGDEKPVVEVVLPREDRLSFLFVISSKSSSTELFSTKSSLPFWGDLVDFFAGDFFEAEFLDAEAGPFVMLDMLRRKRLTTSLLDVDFSELLD